MKHKKLSEAAGIGYFESGLIVNGLCYFFGHCFQFDPTRAGDQAAAMSRKNHAGGILVTASGYTWIYLFTLLFHACHIISECR